MEWNARSRWLVAGPGWAGTDWGGGVLGCPTRHPRSDGFVASGYDRVSLGHWVGENVCRSSSGDAIESE